tara:strand:- start:43 stop:207 length:165 start_codon:yes stop_codon:yes gene_type:complete
MFGFFKKKSALEKLQIDYENLMKESFQLSKSNRSASDKKIADAEKVMQKIEGFS